MSTRSWLDALKSRFLRILNRHERRAFARRGPASRGLKVESLEDRRVLAFDLAIGYPAGANPQAIVSADFTNDDVLDLAVANNVSISTVSVLVGNAASPGVGDGTFQPAVTSAATGSYPRSLAVGDFDGDGNLDVATANSNDVSVLLGNGDGTFQLPQTLSLPLQTVPGASGLSQYPLSVAVGDLTGDGLLDLAVTAQTSYQTRNGPYTGYDYYGNPYSYYTYNTYTNGHVNVLLGDGTGTFTPPAASAVQLLEGSYPISMVLDELDSIPGLDLATADYYGGKVRVLSGNNDGTFDAPLDYSTNWYPTSVMIGDVNGDSISDLVTDNYYSASVLLGNGAAGVGDGTFQAAQTTYLSYYAGSVAVGDVDADGKLDLVVASNYYYYGYEGRVDVLLGHGDGTFGAPRTSTVGDYLAGVATGDFNEDGFPDVAVTAVYTNNVFVLSNDHYWPPTPPPSVSISDVQVWEGNTGTTNATFTVYLSGLADDDVTVHYETADGSAGASDYTGASGDVVIPAGAYSYDVTVAVTGDRLAETTETFAVNLSAQVNATLGDSQGIGTILDDEPRVSINDATVTEGNTGSVNATFTVSLSAYYDADVTVHYATANNTATGGDYATTSGDVTIPAGQLSRQVTVAVTGDRLGESTETYFVNLSAPVNAGIADGQGLGTINDNEPRLSINNVTKKEGNGGSTQFVFTVTLSVAYDQTVTVNYATANGSATAGSDYVAKSGLLTFAAGVRTMTISITVLPNHVKEADETFFVNLSVPSSNALVSVAQGIGTILNDDRK